MKNSEKPGVLSCCAQSKKENRKVEFFEKTNFFKLKVIKKNFKRKADKGKNNTMKNLPKEKDKNYHI